MKKILIIVRKGDLELLSLFPALSILKEKYPESEINILCEADDSEIISFFPAPIKMHFFPINETNILNLHKFSKNSHNIFNIDICFDFREDLKSSLLGKMLNCIDRVGYKSFFKKITFTHVYEIENEMKKDVKKVTLLSKYFEEDFSSLSITSKLLSESLKDDEDLLKVHDADSFILFHVDDIDENFSTYEWWIKAIERFKDQKKVLWIDSGKSLHHESFQKKCRDIPLLKIADTSSKKFLIPLILKSKAMITDGEIWSRLSSYYGIDSFLIATELRKIEYWKHFVKSPNILELRNGKVSLGLFNDDEKIMESDDSWINILYERLGL